MVIKSIRIMKGAITADKVADSLKTHMYIGDETEATSTSTSDEKVKTFNIISDPIYGLNLSKIKWQIENKNTTSNGTTTWTLLIDTTSTMGSGTMTGTTYAMSSGSTNVRLSDGTHPVDIFLKTSTGGTAYNRIFEVYGNVG